MRRSDWAGLILVIAVTAIVVALLVVRRGELWCVDGYYHIRSGQLLRTEGISRTFPWWQETFLRDRWADKDFLYHVLLVPFTFGNLLAGAKVSAVVFAAAMVGTFHEVARRLRVPAPAALTLALLAFAPMLVVRLAFPRSFVLAIALALAGTGAILLDRKRVAAGIAAAYAWTHISYHLLPCLALVHDLHRPRESRSFRMTAWTLGGAIAGLVVNPYFPNNVRLWWVQNIEVLTRGWSAREDLSLGAELLPPPALSLLSLNAGVFLAFLFALWLLARGVKASREAATLLLVASGFFALSLRSMAFLEFAFPFLMLFAGVVLRDGRPTVASMLSSPRARRGALAALAVLTAVLATRTAGYLAEAADRRTHPELGGATDYLRDHAPAGETIFHLDWDEFPQLYLANPQHRYLVGLDPTFMWITDRARWQLWTDVANGRVADAYGPIRTTFKSRFVVANSENEEFLRIARRDPRFVEAHRDRGASVFELAGEPGPSRAWRVTGYWPDPARRLFEERWDREGKKTVEVSAPGFVDLSEAVDLPPTVPDACALAETTVNGAAGGPVRLGIASDDEVRVLVGDAVVYARSPLRAPRPGTPGGPALSLDELDRNVPDTDEREVEVVLAPGPNRVLVKTCRVGEDFGFFLRVR